MSPEEIREHATTVILNRARSATFTDVTEILALVTDGYELADVEAILELTRTADLTVEFPPAPCPIVTEFLNVKLPCTQPATVEMRGRCERGHGRVRIVCAMHAEGFARMRAAVMCAQCAEAGDTNVLMSVAPHGADQ